MTKKRKRARSRILSVALAVFLVVSLIPTGFGTQASETADTASGLTDASSTFTDVSSSDWYFGSVKHVTEKKYFEGTGAGEFSPNAPMTRAMFVTVLSRLAGANVSDDVSRFEDVRAGAWYAGEVAWAYENGLASGTGDGCFSPDKSVTRQEMAAFMSRYISYYTEKNKVTLESAGSARVFTDGDKISSYAVDAVGLCSSYGLIDGYTDGSFDPMATASRAQVAAVIHRLDLLLEGDEPAAETTSAAAVISGGGSGGSRITTSEKEAATAADFEAAAEASKTHVTAKVKAGSNLTVNDDVTIVNNNVSELTLNLGSANLGDFTINSESARTITIDGDASSVESLTINAPYATVTNNVTVNGAVDIEAVSNSTFVNKAKIGSITIKGKGAVEDKYVYKENETPAPVVIATTEPAIVKGNSTNISVVADGAQLTVAPAENVTPKVESAAAEVKVNVNTNNEVTISGTVKGVTTTAEKPKLTIDGTVENIKVEKADKAGTTAIEVKGTGSISTMETGKAEVTIKAAEKSTSTGSEQKATLSIEKVTASGGKIEAPADTISTVKVEKSESGSESDSTLKLNAPVKTVEATENAKIDLGANITVQTIEAKGNLELGGSGEVVSIDVQASTAAITVTTGAALDVIQVTTTAENTDKITVTGLVDDVTIQIKAARPTNVKAVAPTAAGGKGGLTGVAKGMEYKSIVKTSWTDISEATTSEGGLTPGAYQVRVAADTSKNVLASEIVTVTIPEAVGVNKAEIQGTPYVGETLTAVANADATDTLHYEWKTGDTVIGTDSKTLTLSDDMTVKGSNDIVDVIGKTITVRIYNYNGETAATDTNTQNAAGTQDTATSTATAAVSVNKSTLEKLLAKANEIQNGVTEKADGTTEGAVAEGVVFVTTADKTALTNAINAATTVENNTKATSKEVADAEIALRNANEAFVKAKKTGTRNDVTELQNALKALIENAKTIETKDNESSGDGSDTGTATEATAVIIASDAESVAPGAQWVTSTAASIYSEAIATADGTTSSSVITDLTGAISNLNSAITTYLKAIQKGAALDSSALLTAINAAELNAASVETSTNGSDVLPSKTWVTSGALSAYKAAITAAKSTTATTQSTYNTALSTLNTATTEFNKAKQAGKKDITAPTVTNITATLDGTTAAISFTTNEAGKYTYKLRTGINVTATSISAGAVSFNITDYTTSGNDGNNKQSISVTVSDETGNATQFTVIPSSNVVQVLKADGSKSDTYETLTAAINAATAGDTVKLLKNITLSESVDVSKAITIDLNGKTITGVNVRALHVKKETLTLTGTGIVTSIGKIDIASSVIRVGDGATTTRSGVVAGLILGENVTVNAPASYGVTAFGDTTETVTIYGTVNATAAKVNESYDGCAVATNGTIASDATINIEESAIITAASTNAIYMPSGTLNVKGGTITGTTGIYAKSATVNITGGTIAGNGAKKAYSHYGNGGIPTGDALVVDSCGYPGTVNVNVSGGSFKSEHANAVGSYAGNSVTTAALGFITGGAFSSDPTIYLASGYTIDKNGEMYTVREGTKAGETANNPIVISSAEDLKKVQRTDRYTYYKVDNGFATIDCSDIDSISLYGEFDGAGVTLTGIKNGLFRYAGNGQSATGETVFKNFTAVMANSPNALVFTIDGENTTFENVTVSGILEGNWNMGAFVSYGTCNADDVGYNYILNFTNCSCDATIIAKQNSSAAVLVGHIYPGTGHTARINLDSATENGIKTAKIYASGNATGCKYFSNYSNPLNVYVDGVAATDQTITATALATTVPVKSNESSRYTLQTGATTKSVKAQVVAQLTAYDNTGNEIANTHGITMTLGTIDFDSDPSGSSIKLFDLITGVEINNEATSDGRLGYKLENGELTVYTNSTTNYVTGTVSIIATQYNVDGALIGTGSLVIAEKKTYDGNWTII